MVPVLRASVVQKLDELLLKAESVNDIRLCYEHGIKNREGLGEPWYQSYMDRCHDKRLLIERSAKSRPGESCRAASRLG